MSGVLSSGFKLEDTASGPFGEHWSNFFQEFNQTYRNPALIGILEEFLFEKERERERDI